MGNIKYYLNFFVVVVKSIFYSKITQYAVLSEWKDSVQDYKQGSILIMTLHCKTTTATKAKTNQPTKKTSQLFKHILKLFEDADCFSLEMLTSILQVTLKSNLFQNYLSGL